VRKAPQQRLVRARKALGHKEAASITRRNVIDFLDEVKKTAPVQANRIQTIITGIYNWSVEEELLDINPIAGLKKRAKESASERALTDGEIRVLWKAFDAAGQESITGLDVAEALKAVLLCGQRPGEVVGALQRELVNLGDKEARWEIGAERMKARRAHVVPLAPMARAIFEAAVARRRAEDGRGGVFGSRYLGRETLARHSLSQAMKRIVPGLKAEGADKEIVEGLQANPPTPHDFRRTVATGMAALGIPREDRLAVLAHVAADVHGRVYDKFERLPQKSIALETWERHVAKVLGQHTEPTTVVPITKRLRRASG
jgi:integrase